jgi:alginate O-acetyltransferase complex protein AlgI
VVFTSWAFVAFFLCVLSALALVRSRTSRQLVILLASIFFYGYWNKLYLFLLAAPSITDYYCAIFIEAFNRDLPACRDWWKYALFVTYSPELIAGPIVRASVFLPK